MALKNILHKVQELGRKAEELKTAVQSIPGKAAEIRQAVTMSAGELHQMRAEVQTDLMGLRAGNEDRLLHAMREINDSTYTFEEAGYELSKLELDLTTNHRLIVNLKKFSEVSESVLQSLFAQETREMTKSILAGLMKAEKTARTVQLTHLSYDGVLMHVGANPLIRLCWSSDTLQEAAQTIAATVAQPIVSTPTPGSPAFGSFFEKQKKEIAIPAQAPIPSSPIVSEFELLPKISIPVASSSSDSEKPVNRWSSESLERFKKMPSASKYS